MENVDYRLLSDTEFNVLLNKIQSKAYDIAKHTAAVAQVEYTINRKNLRNTENLQEAMGLPRDLKKIDTENLEKLDRLLGLFETDDVFLGTREIETLAKNTDLPEVKTQRQIIQSLFPGIPLSKLKAVTATFKDYMQSPSALSQDDPFKEYMVLYLRELISQEEIEYRAEERKVNELAKAARKSRPRRLLDKVVPTDVRIREYLEEEDLDTKVQIAKTMTNAELDFAHYLQEGWAKKRDYLLKREMLKGYIENYVTHRKRSFLESWLKNDSPTPGKFKWLKNFARALKETFYDNQKLDQAQLNILNTKTGTILPLEKWFKYAMHRSGNLIPTNNMATAYLGYEKTFGRKKTLDMYMPKIEAAARALAPTETTEHGLIMDDSLVEFVKEFINTQKGRPMAYGRVLQPGNGLDIALRLGVGFVRFKALAFNFVSQFTSPIGEQYATFIELGTKKYLRGVIRARAGIRAPKAKRIIKKYEALIGEKLWGKLAQQSKDIGSKFGELAFAGFSIGSRKANIIHFLGEMTPEEYRKEEIDPKRLAQIKNEMARWRPDDQLAGIVAKTSVGSIMRQFRSWAIPIATQTYKNLKKVSQIGEKDGFKSAVKSKEMGQLFRAIVPTLLILALLHNMWEKLKNKKNRSLKEQIAYKAIQEVTSSLSALTPSTFASPAPLYDWSTKTAKALETYISALSTGKKDKEGNIAGSSQIESAFTPAILNQFTKGKKTDLEKAMTKDNEKQKEKASRKESAYEDIKDLPIEQQLDEIQKISETDDKLAEDLLSMVEDELKGITDEDRKIKSLGVENGSRAEYVYSQVIKFKTFDEKMDYLAELADKGVISDEVFDQIIELMDL